MASSSNETTVVQPMDEDSVLDNPKRPTITEVTAVTDHTDAELLSGTGSEVEVRETYVDSLDQQILGILKYPTFDEWKSTFMGYQYQNSSDVIDSISRNKTTKLMDMDLMEPLHHIAVKDTEEDKETDQDSITTQSISPDGSIDGSPEPSEPEPPRVKMIFNVRRIFLEMVASDIKKLSRFEKQNLTREGLLESGMKIAAYMFMDYNKINSDWPMELQQQCGITTKRFPNINK